MTTQAITPRWLGWAEAARYSGLGARTLQRLAAEGRLPTSRPRANGRRGRTLLDRLALDALLEQAARRPAT